MIDPILLEMNSLLERLRSAIKSYEIAQDTLNEEKKRIDEQALSHQDRHIELATREASVSHIERADQMMKDSQIKMDQALESGAKLDSDRKEFNTYKEEQLSIIKQASENQLKEGQMNEKNRLALDDRSAKLDEEVQQRVNVILSKMNKG